MSVHPSLPKDLSVHLSFPPQTSLSLHPTDLLWPQVGSAFSDPDAVEELHTIASEPSKDHVFRVDNFDALQGIQNQLQEKIFAIEGTGGTGGGRGSSRGVSWWPLLTPRPPPGTQSADSSSFQLEMAQEGFSALLTPVSVPPATRDRPHARGVSLGQD